MSTKTTFLLALAFVAFSCTKTIEETPESTDGLSGLRSSASADASSHFSEVGQIDIGDVGAAEISAFDPLTDRLFVVNNGAVNKIDILDLQNPSAPVLIGSISMAPYGGLVNSVAVKNGLLAAAIEALDKQQPGRVAVFSTDNYAEVKVIPVGALPDMVTFSPDGHFILTANEGEPNSDYTVDPVGTVSIISVPDGYSVTDLDFARFAPQQQELERQGLLIFGPGASFAQDLEPEYIAVSEDSRTAWVTLQENNAIARISIPARQVTGLFPLGFKDHSLAGNSLDPSDRDGGVNFNSWPVKGVYMPDAIAVLEDRGFPLLFTANEGDAREYDAFVEAKRGSTLVLDPVTFPNAASLQGASALGRLNLTSTLGDKDGDGDYDALFSFGARSFSIWHGQNGRLLFDSGNDLDKRAVQAGAYDDARSDDKGAEPEGLALGPVAGRTLLFVGLERVDGVAVYDVTDPLQPSFLQLLHTGDAPEGVLFVPDSESPTGRSLLVVSSENDGVIKVFSTLAL